MNGIYPFPAGMQAREIETNGAKIHVRVGGHGPAVVMLHGFGTTGDMWGHLASALIEDHMVVAPDLRRGRAHVEPRSDAYGVWFDVLELDSSVRAGDPCRASLTLAFARGAMLLAS